MKRSSVWAASWVGVAMITLACGGGSGTIEDEGDASGDCPPTLSYELVGKPFVAKYCLTCHSPSTSDRHEAPRDANFDTLAGIRARGVLMHTFVQEGRMPPPEFSELPDPSAQERDTYVAWLECSGASKAR